MFHSQNHKFTKLQQKQKLTPSTEFLNDIVKQLWPNINAYGSKTIKDVVEPMFKTMLPGPLKTLHFTKIDLGPEPLRLSNARTTRTDAEGIKLDMNVDWASKSDIEMDADMMPALVSLISFVAIDLNELVMLIS